MLDVLSVLVMFFVMLNFPVWHLVFSQRCPGVRCMTQKAFCFGVEVEFGQIAVYSEHMLKRGVGLDSRRPLK